MAWPAIVNGNISTTVGSLAVAQSLLFALHCLGADFCFKQLTVDLQRLPVLRLTAVWMTNVSRAIVVKVRGAVDDLDRVLQILEDTGYEEERFYIHCDGALFGLMVRLCGDS